MDNKINFLNTAISDAQDLIRFIDSKTAVIITILGAFVASYFLSIEKIVTYSSDYSLCFWISLMSFIIYLFLCILVTLRIIKPTNNPVENLNLEEAATPLLKYFIPTNSYTNKYLFPFFNSKNYKLTEKFKPYIKNLTKSKDNDILEILTLELFKVNYLRNIKNDRLNTQLWLLLFTSILFTISYLILNIESIEIAKQIEIMAKKGNCHCQTV